jgi:hypothetical protein
MSDRSNDDDRPSGPRDEELARTAENLADALRDLREEVGPRPPRPRRGPLGLPRPPSPREVLRFADDVAIPTAIAVLEANIKILEGIQKTIRLADTERRARQRGEEVRDRAREQGGVVRDRATAVGRETLDRLDDALAELQTAVEEGSLPREETSREILTEARELRADLERQVREAERTVDEQRRAEREEHSSAGEETSGGNDPAANDPTADDDTETDDNETDGEDDASDPQVDVDAELQSIKDRFGNDEDDEDGENE